MLEILPDKLTPFSQTVIGHAARLISFLANEQTTVSSLFLHVRVARPDTRFDDFAMALTFLYAAGFLIFEDGFLKVENI